MLESLEMMDTFLALFGLYLVGCGVAALLTGKIYGHGTDFGAKYTEESTRTAAPAIGIGTALVGLAMIAFKLAGMTPALSAYAWYILIALAGAGIVFVILGYRKLIEK